jgi:hypothetical protein
MYYIVRYNTEFVCWGLLESIGVGARNERRAKRMRRAPEIENIRGRIDRKRL